VTGASVRRRAAALSTLAALLVTLPPLGQLPAGAAIRRQAVVSCPSGPQECWPAAFAFTPAGQAIYYVERFSGEIRRFLFDGRRDSRFARIRNVGGSGEQGVLGIALDPRWGRGPRFRWVYIYYTQDSPSVNRIVRLRKRAGGGIRTQLLTRSPANTFHNGGIIHFGPDGNLYAVTGDAGNPGRSQNRRNNAGKVLRMTKTGRRPAGNPFARSLAFSFGHRNSYGFTFDPRTRALWQTENGPECEDEINLVRKGRNYGWGPGSDCPNTSTSGPNPARPKKKFTPPPALTGATFCIGCHLGAAPKGDLLFGSFNDDRIRRAPLRNDRTDLGRVRTLYNHGRGVLSLESHPRTGSIFFSDSRGIYRLVRG
jgi:glucose/arabinose dehydrogenase